MRWDIKNDGDRQRCIDEALNQLALLQERMPDFAVSYNLCFPPEHKDTSAAFSPPQMHALLEDIFKHASNVKNDSNKFTAALSGSELADAATTLHDTFNQWCAYERANRDSIDSQNFAQVYAMLQTTLKFANQFAAAYNDPVSDPTRFGKDGFKWKR